MGKLLVLLPYIYLEEPLPLGQVTLYGVPDWKGRDHRPPESDDWAFLKELSVCFPTTRGLASGSGGVKVTSYFLLDRTNGLEKAIQIAKEVVTLLRYALLRPDDQALESIEQLYFYAFSLPPEGFSPPPEGVEGYHIFQCWPNLNQEVWIHPKEEKFPPPAWYVDVSFVHEDQIGYTRNLSLLLYAKGLSEEEKSRVLRAMDWYNQSFLKYSVRGIDGRLVDIATAFETLFDLPRHNKQKEFKQRIKAWLGFQGGSPIDKWADDFYGNVRSATVHSGQPDYLLFTHPDAQVPHLGFLWSAQRIFRECVAVKLGLLRQVDNDGLIEELTPNEVHLKSLRAAGGYENFRKSGLLTRVEKLRPIYPPGNREDITWLGMELLGAYKRHFVERIPQALPTLDQILASKDAGPRLGLMYYQFLKEFREVYFRYMAVGWDDVDVEELGKLEPINAANIEQMALESAIYHFAQFAGWALSLP